jgi:iduronate 2-sulfatase
MRRYSYLFGLLPVVWLGELSGASSVPSPEAVRPPNVLMIFVDDLKDTVGAMGHPNALTPHLDKLASEGVLFSEAYCQAPICGPSRASLMLGLRPSTTGIYGQIEDEDIRSTGEGTRYAPFLPEYFKAHGYHTMGVGKLFHTHVPAGILDESGGRRKGFGPKPEDDQPFKWKAEGTSTDWGAFPESDAQMPDVEAAAWAVERLQRDYDQPFFLGVGFLRPHVPWYVPQTWFDLYDKDSIVMPPWRADDFADIPAIAHRMDELPMMPTTEWAIESGEWRNILQAYLACVTFADAQVGKVLRALEESPHADNTIVVLLSDHGYRLGEKGTFAKNCLWQEATRVPLILSGPGIEKAHVATDPVELLDLYPTLLDLTGLPANHLNEGKTLRPQLEGHAGGADQAALVTYGRNNHAVRAFQYYYIRYEDGAEELYDLESDPNAFDNIAEAYESAPVIEQLRSHLPKRNRAWTPGSSSSWPAYLVEQMSAQLAANDFCPEEVLQYCVWQTRRALEAMPDAEGQPATIPHGEQHWERKPAGAWSWTHGFWPGILWQVAALTEDPLLKQAARDFTASLEPLLKAPPRSHDMGFIFNSSFGRAYDQTAEAGYRDGLIQAADALMELYNPQVGTLMSWPNKVRNGEFAPHNTIIDSLLNLELLFVASRLTGDSRYAAAAVSHANTVMREHIRTDGGTFHVVVFDDKTGGVEKKGTHQGYADTSTWARGQAWGIYGFAMCYRETGDPAYLETAKGLADHFIKRLPGDVIPFWDFDDPAIPDAPRDASAAAIAASGMLQMAESEPDSTEAVRHVARAQAILEALSTEAYRPFRGKVSFLDHSTGNRPRDREVDVPIIYADYYFLEALNRLKRFSDPTVFNNPPKS